LVLCIDKIVSSKQILTQKKNEKTSMFLECSILAIVSCKERRSTTNWNHYWSDYSCSSSWRESWRYFNSVGKDGIDVSTKNGSNETNVTVGAGWCISWS
jgi:hypothetical protein